MYRQVRSSSEDLGLPVYAEITETGLAMGPSPANANAPVALQLFHSEIRPGSLLMGQLAYHCTKSVETTPIRVELCRRVTIFKKSESWIHKGVSKVVTRVLAEVLFPAHELAGSVSQVIPFTLQVPLKLETCPYTPRVHTNWPLSTHSSYDVDSRVPGTVVYFVRVAQDPVGTYCCAPVKMRHSGERLSLANFVDESNQSLGRDSHAVSSLSGKCPKYGKGVLVFTGPPLFHDFGYSNSGNYNIKITFLPGGHASERRPPLDISSVDFCVSKTYLSSPNGLGYTLAKSSETTGESYEIQSLGKVVEKHDLTPLTDHEWSLTIHYKFPRTTVLQPGSFVSCNLAVIYNISIRIKHQGGSSKLTLPFVVEHSQSRQDLESGHAPSLIFSVHDEESLHPTSSGWGT